MTAPYFDGPARSVLQSLLLRLIFRNLYLVLRSKELTNGCTFPKEKFVGSNPTRPVMAGLARKG